MARKKDTTNSKELKLYFTYLQPQCYPEKSIANNPFLKILGDEITHYETRLGAQIIKGEGKKYMETTKLENTVFKNL